MFFLVPFISVHMPTNLVTLYHNPIKDFQKQVFVVILDQAETDLQISDRSQINYQVQESVFERTSYNPPNIHYISSHERTMS